MRASTLTVVTIVALLLLVVAPETAIQTQETNTHRLEEVAEGVYFAVGTGSVFVMSNALVIVNDEDVSGTIGQRIGCHGGVVSNPVEQSKKVGFRSA